MKSLLPYFKTCSVIISKGVSLSVSHLRQSTVIFEPFLVDVLHVKQNLTRPFVHMGGKVGVGVGLTCC